MAAAPNYDQKQSIWPEERARDALLAQYLQQQVSAGVEPSTSDGDELFRHCIQRISTLLNSTNGPTELFPYLQQTVEHEDGTTSFVRKPGEKLMARLNTLLIEGNVTSALATICMAESVKHRTVLDSFKTLFRRLAVLEVNKPELFTGEKHITSLTKETQTEPGASQSVEPDVKSEMFYISSAMLTLGVLPKLNSPLERKVLLELCQTPKPLIRNEYDDVAYMLGVNSGDAIDIVRKTIQKVIENGDLETVLTYKNDVQDGIGDGS